MKWTELLAKVGRTPVIEAESLLAGETNAAQAKVQLLRWHKAGKLIQLKRGFYILAEPYRRTTVNQYHIASLLKWPSYVSLEKALGFYGLIPDVISECSSVTTKRANTFRSVVGSFRYWHIKPELFWGYQELELDQQRFFMAFPEKALLDFVYLRGMKLSSEYLDSLRLQNLEALNPEKILEYAERFTSPGMSRAAKVLVKYMSQSAKEHDAT